MKNRTVRQKSNIYSCLTQKQISELRQTFDILDRDNNGLISKEDLVEFNNSIGSPFSVNQIESMIAEFGGEGQFITLLTYISEILSPIDDEREIYKALNDFADNGILKSYKLKKHLGLSEEDYNILIKDCVEDGLINYKKLATIIKYGEDVK